MSDEMDDENKFEKTMIVTTKADLNQQKPPQLAPYLIQISGQETGKMVPVSGKKLRIGRDPSCEIYVEDPHVSRFHAEVFHFDSGIAIRDSGSTNGIFINGKKIQEQILTDGDKILVGTRLYFKFCYQDLVEQSYQQNIFLAANIDSLTQLYNKKYFIDALSKEFSFSSRGQSPLSLLMMDLDYFKKINDTYGHLAGDLVLKTIGAYLLKHTRLENIACRYGGEEFALILRNVSTEVAVNIAERIRAAIEQERITYRGIEIPVTVSCGVATYQNKNLERFEDLILAADEKLYLAKQKGRNQVIWKLAA